MTKYTTAELVALCNGYSAMLRAGQDVRHVVYFYSALIAARFA